MMEKSNQQLYVMSDRAILQTLGNFIQQTRLAQNKTQQQVANSAGVNRSTVLQVEHGGGATLLSYIQILRALEQLDKFPHFEINRPVSPLQLAKLELKKRQRASTGKTTSNNLPKSDW